MEEDQEEMNVTNAAEAREKIQEIIEELQNEQPNLIDPKNDKIDKKMKTLDQIFTQYCQLENEEDGSQSKKSVNVSQAQMDIEAFRILATINHQRIRAVQSTSWAFRATDFASRIVKLVNTSGDRSPSEDMTSSGRQKLFAMIAPHVNCCVPLQPILGSIVLEEAEAAPKERRQRQAKQREVRVAPVKQNPLKPEEIGEEDQNTKVAKHVEYIFKCLKKEYENSNKQPISYYHFVVDPKSFSNTVENIFYASFLIKDGFIALRDDDGLPVLDVMPKGHTRDLDVTQSQQASVTKKQLIISLDQGLWQELVKELRLERAKIDHEAKLRHVQKRPRL